MKRQKIIWSVSAVISALGVGVLIFQPLLIKSVLARYKSTDHFLVLEEDPRIHYEETAERYAHTLADMLDSSQSAVESVLNSTFRKPIEIYICASQKAFNQYVFLSTNARGAVYWGKMFLSPGAFNRGSIAELTKHELTHYLFLSHLGRTASINGIPIWFREGIAVFVANGGGAYTRNTSIRSVMSNEERSAFLSGRTDFWFASNDPRDALTNTGVVNWLVYRVGAMLVHYMRDSQPERFNALIQSLLSGEVFNSALESAYGESMDSVLSGFRLHLTQ